MVGTLSPFKSRGGGDRFGRTSFPTPSWRPGPLGPEEGGGLLVGSHGHTWLRPRTGQRTRGHGLALTHDKNVGEGPGLTRRKGWQARTPSRPGHVADMAGEARAGGGCQRPKGGQRVRKRRGREVSPAQVYPPQRKGGEGGTLLLSAFLWRFF